jgi:purine-binding chemotaxis protein CheW
MNQDNLSRINSYLSFKLGDEEFAAHVGKVLNILEMTRITEVPKAPAYMKGVINLRGTVLPVIDTRIKFGMPPTEYTTNTCIIVLDIQVDGESIQIGALVDAVQAVLEIDKGKIMPPPSIGSKYKSEFIEGVANIDEKFIMILDMDAVFSTEEVSNLKTKTDETDGKEDIEKIGE